MNKLAKALYDNTAECADELAFKKGDIVMVMDQHVAGTSGWWMCSLYGRHGLAPANRLKLLSQTEIQDSPSFVSEKSKLTQGKSYNKEENIYNTPSTQQSTNSPTYERMDMIYRVPNYLSSSIKHSAQSALQHSTEGPETTFLNMASSPKGEVYDVPCQPRRASLFTESTLRIQVSQKQQVVPLSQLEKRLDSPESLKCASPGACSVYVVPPPLPQNPNYDIPAPPGTTESMQRMTCVYDTELNPVKPEWIYDVPARSGTQSPQQSSCDTWASNAICRQIYDPLPAHTLTIDRENPASSLYDIPKPSSLDISSPPKVLPRIPLCDKAPTQQLKAELIYAVPPNYESLPKVVSDASSDQKSLECRSDSNNISELKWVRLQRMRNFLTCVSLHDLPGNGDSMVQEDEQGRILCFTASGNQRISTASTSSASSCDSLTLSQSSPESLCEVTLSQDEVCCKLFNLQESVCRAVPQLMDFVSSNWRYKEHLEKHLKEIKEAAEGIACSLMSFLNFALDIKGNAYRLNDANLQTRLFKQLSIIEDSGVILQQTVNALNVTGWSLSTLCQDPGHVYAPDQLDRFVMVARTVPDDVKRLVSIFHANSKLLFRAPQKDLEFMSTTDPAEMKKGSDTTEQGDDLIEEDNDYVELQNKDVERKLEEVQREPRENVPPVLVHEKKNNTNDHTVHRTIRRTVPNGAVSVMCAITVFNTHIRRTANKKHHSCNPDSSAEEHQPPPLPEHCRLYFGALQKAIAGFVGGLHNGLPPEKFISQSKLVIMVGQRLVDTLCREAQRGGSSQKLLCKSNHLCALLKQLAVATKKAALHFPDEKALFEAQEFAKELAQRAQHFRISLDL
ncbi:cas scaffolding protein family member 4 isoform X2 [Cololabis saira]|uniref:cas scaffolding protein family member 4 isoform X2 n=1 Tax=Cololabis saira TaxID=129043 RepID=UPI002AD563A7|nr:cas scaffolding protein family member 4 isoform X2 [Cololabis saira]